MMMDETITGSFSTDSHGNEQFRNSQGQAGEQSYDTDAFDGFDTAADADDDQDGAMRSGIKDTIETFVAQDAGIQTR